MAPVNRIERAAEDADASRAVGASSRVRRPAGATPPGARPHRFQQLGHALSPLTPDTPGTAGRAPPRARSSATTSSSCVGSTASILLAATICGLAASVGWNSSSSCAHRVEVLDRIAARGARDVDQVHEHLGALEMAQELMAEALAAVRAFDQPGHVGDDEAAVVARADDAEVRHSVVNG